MKKKYIILLLIVFLASGLEILPGGSLMVRHASAKINKKITLNKGKSRQLTFNHRVKKWRSSNKRIVTVNRRGIVKAKRVGKAVITASYGKWKRKVAVTVKDNGSAKKASSKDKENDQENVVKITLRGKTRGVVTELSWAMPEMSNAVGYSGGTAVVYRSQGDYSHYQAISNSQMSVSENEDYIYKDADTSLLLNTVYYYQVVVFSYENKIIARSGNLKSSHSDWRYFSDSMELAGDTYYLDWEKGEYTITPTGETWIRPNRLGAGARVEYYAGGKYQYFTGTFGISAESECECSKRILIYADGVLIGRSKWFSYLSNPISIRANIAYANTIRIEAEYGEEHYDEYGYGICDEHYEDVLLNNGKFCN